MRWLDDIKTRFITEYTGNVVCHFTDGDFYRNMSTGALVAAQPDNTEWLRFNIVRGSTFNSTIGVAASQLKSELFNVTVTIFVPRSKTFNTAASIEPLIDSAMMFQTIMTADPGCIVLDTLEPKLCDTFYAQDGEVWNQIKLTYQYSFRYI